jgi:phosphate starvation-inducible PhoH-like protein
MSDRLTLELEPADTLRLANLCGQFDEHLKQIESRLGVDIFCRGNLFTIQGPKRTSRAARRLLQSLYRLSATEVLTPDVINLHLQESGMDELAGPSDPSADDEITVKTKRGMVRGRGPNQRGYLQAITRNAINFGVGPAGTGKTYLAVACAVAALQADQESIPT